MHFFPLVPTCPEITCLSKAEPLEASGARPVYESSGGEILQLMDYFFGSIFFHACQISLTKGLAKESILAHF